MLKQCQLFMSDGADDCLLFVQLLFDAVIGDFLMPSNAQQISVTPHFKSQKSSFIFFFNCQRSDRKPGFQGHCIFPSRISRNRCVLGTKLQKNTNRKPLNLSNGTTFNDLE